MTKYKHRITGDVVVYDNGSYRHNSLLCSIPKDWVENSSDWELVVERDFEIVSIRRKEDGAIFLYNKLTDNLTQNEIYTVRRLCDGELFKIGDIVFQSFYTPPFKIESFTAYTNNVLVFSGNKGYNIDNLTRVLFITFDGVSITEPNTTVYSCLKNPKSTDQVLYYEVRNGFEPKENRLYFAEENKCKTYIENNIPKYNKQEVLNMCKEQRIICEREYMNADNNMDACRQAILNAPLINLK